MKKGKLCGVITFCAVLVYLQVAVIINGDIWNQRFVLVYNDLTTKNEEPFISYELNRNHSYNNTFGHYVHCNLETNRVALHKALAESLDFTTTFSTKLKLLVLGDSVGIQMNHILEEAAGALFENRRILRYSWGDHEGIPISAPVRGGGVIAGYRVTGMLLRRGEGKSLPNSPGGGWLRDDVRRLLNHTYGPDNVESVGSFDAMLYRIPHGWLRLDEITKDRLLESLKLAHELFGVSTVIIPTLFFMNNVENEKDLDNLAQVNEMIRGVAGNWTPRAGVERVMVMEFGNWTFQLAERNAQLIGIDTSLKNYTLGRLGCKKHPPSIAQVCAQKVEIDSCRDCVRNRLTRDGMHWCMESIGGQFVAGVSCLLGCPYNSNSEENCKSCEKRCNDDFMSLSSFKVSNMNLTYPSQADPDGGIFVGGYLNYVLCSA